MTDRLSHKEKGFVRDIVRGKNATQAALNNYDTEDKNVAANIGCTNLMKPKIENAIKSIAEQIPNELLVEKHLELLNVPKKVRTIVKGEVTDEYEELDSNAIKSGLDMAYKLKGSYAAEKKLVEVTTELTDEILKKAKAFDEFYQEQLEGN